MRYPWHKVADELKADGPDVHLDKSAAMAANIRAGRQWPRISAVVAQMAVHGKQNQFEPLVRANFRRIR